MKPQFAFLLVAVVLAGCASHSTTSVHSDKGSASIEKVDTFSDATSTAGTVDGYKRDLAQRISQVSSTKVYEGRPQALLRSVVVVRYSVDAHGNLTKSEIIRSNHDKETEGTALTSLRKAAPFPKPASHLLRRGHLEVSETWLFNSDGRFQLRSIAQPQMDH